MISNVSIFEIFFILIGFKKGLVVYVKSLKVKVTTKLKYKIQSV